MGVSPAHYKSGSNRSTKPMLLGSAADDILLGGDAPVVYDGQRRGKAWKEFKAANAGRRIITATEAAKVTAMVDAVRAHKEATRLLTGKRRQELRWKYLGRDVVSHP